MLGGEQLVFANSIGALFSCSRDLSIRQWSIGSETPAATLTGHTTNVAALDVSTGACGQLALHHE